MAVEIRELVIRTHIQTREQSRVNRPTEENLNAMKKQILDECKRMIHMGTHRPTYKR